MSPVSQIPKVEGVGLVAGLLLRFNFESQTVVP
jgi:hypothetical protein